MTIHISKVGTYHPAGLYAYQDIENGWTINDTRDSIDPGPSCSECGACECDAMIACPYCTAKGLNEEITLCRMKHDSNCEYFDAIEMGEGGCVGLSFAYCNLDDGSENLCEDCATKAGIEIVSCDC